MVDLINTGLILLSSAGFVTAVYLTYTLSRETRGGRYWLAFLAASVGLGTHEWLKVASIVFDIHPRLWKTLTEAGVVFGSFALAYGAYGIQQSVREIKERTGG
ncbi:MAG: hypothetical protein SVU32_08640 [Candidatus Nanohaloarchaea archaeon]|nr:hypothetical protein [Candidatus Nanohaloarchaea archaeon]